MQMKGGSGERGLHIADVVDEVHPIVIARSVLKCYHESMHFAFEA